VRYASDVGLAIALLIVIYLVASKLLGPPRHPVVAADLAAALTDAADTADAQLAALGHHMTWQDPGGPAGREAAEGTCQACGGVAIISGPVVEKRAGGTITSSQARAEYQPPLADADQLLPCPGGERR
jgi:hypothetical protein